MKLLVRRKVFEEIIKSFGVKYKYKKLINGKWRYYYSDNNVKKINWYDRDATKTELREFIQEAKNNKKYEEYIKICDVPSHFADKLQKVIGVRIRRLVMNSSDIRHALRIRHNISEEDLLTFRKVIQNKKTIIEKSGETWSRKQKLIKFEGYSNGIIQFYATYNKYGELNLFDCYRKEDEEELEKSVKAQCTSPKPNALDGSQPILIITLL